jgi:hypothetical protein
MIKPDIPYSTWTRCNQYPKGGRNEGSLTVTDRFFCDESIFDVADLVELETLEYEGLRVSSTNFDVNETQHLVYVTLVYSRSNSDGTSYASDGVSEYTMEDSGQEVPIDMRKQDGNLRFSNYKTNMNHILAAKRGVTAAYPNWATANDTEMAEEYANKYRWCKDVSDVLDGWYSKRKKTKRIESVFVPSPVVVETTRFANYTAACGKHVKVGSKVTPTRDFGYTGEWLVISSNIYADGKKWVCQTRYQNADEWDGDFYS